MKVITYYQVIADSTAQTDCAFFIEFMLTVIEETLSESQIITPQAVLEIMEQYPGLAEFYQYPRSRTELQAFCHLSDREHFRKAVLAPLLDAGWLLRTQPDKPNSPRQKYFREH
ncbi:MULTISPECIES: Fic family protein [Nitrosomonas]|uniref:Fic family protein n=1 Tax=Nitrosomonas TaxID=914 RepID=UPI00079944C4|nr:MULTISPECIES: hypothetical protein [Nitrosomonas]KXK43326.1 MAG: hypothetical protein UZ02_AOB001001268 [Nitrosomonas europaea]